MNGKLRWTGLIAVAAILLGAWPKGDGTRSDMTVDLALAAPVAGGQSPPSSSKPRTRGVSGLASSAGVDPAVIHPLAGRAFMLRRTGGYRTGPAPGETALDYVRRLLPAADRGDARATFDIWLVLSDCRSALAPDATSALPSMAKAGVDVDRARADLVVQAQACEELLVEPRLVSFDWLGRAAEQGSVEAMLVYANLPTLALGTPGEILEDPLRPVKVRERAMRYLQQAVALGNVDALRSLSYAYEEGLLTDKDPVRAYAYWMAAERMDPLVPVQVPGIPAFPVRAERLAEALSPEQRRLAPAMVDRIQLECCR